jgi:uncharacterized repeat protein (TIGR01451 family)
MGPHARERGATCPERPIARYLLVPAALATVAFSFASLLGSSGQASPATSSYVVTGDGSIYWATPQGTGTTYTGTLKHVMESAAQDLNNAGGGTMTFASGTFDFGIERFLGRDLVNITFQGQGMDITVLQNNSSAAADTEPFDMHDTNRIVVRDMTVNAGGPFRSTSDALDFDGGNDVVVERVKITQSRARGIVFDGKDISDGLPRTADRNVIRNCVITGVQGDGVEFLAANNNQVEQCTITDVGGHGIQMAKSSTLADQPNKKSNENVITGNHVENSGQDGINVTAGDGNDILGNTVLNSSNITAGRDGIRIGSADSITCDDNVVSGNTSGDNQTTKTQRYGLSISSSLCNRTVVWQNTFFGNLSGAINDLGTDTRYTAPPPQAADLALTKTDPPGRVPVGRNMTYTLAVLNGGPDAASGVTVIDQLPPTVTFVSATQTQGTCGESGGNVTCTLGTIGNGGTATIHIVVTPTEPGTITNTASASSSTPDPHGENNSDSETTSVCRITSRRSSIPCG